MSSSLLENASERASLISSLRSELKKIKKNQRIKTAYTLLSPSMYSLNLLILIARLYLTASATWALSSIVKSLWLAASALMKSLRKSKNGLSLGWRVKVRAYLKEFWVAVFSCPAIWNKLWL